MNTIFKVGQMIEGVWETHVGTEHFIITQILDDTIKNQKEFGNELARVEVYRIRTQTYMHPTKSVLQDWIQMCNFKIVHDL